MAGLVLLGLGGVCLHGSVAGLWKPAAVPASDKEEEAETGAEAEASERSAEPVYETLPLLRKLKPLFVS